MSLPSIEVPCLVLEQTDQQSRRATEVLGVGVHERRLLAVGTVMIVVSPKSVRSRNIERDVGHGEVTDIVDVEVDDRQHVVDVSGDGSPPRVAAADSCSAAAEASSSGCRRVEHPVAGDARRCSGW